MTHVWARWIRSARRLTWAASCAIALIAILWPRSASAYPWMIRHEYQGCVPCHADPSGAGLLTEYGRAMGENVLRTRYGSKPADEVPTYARAFFGMPNVDWLLIGASLRGAVYMTATPGQPNPNPATAMFPTTVLGPFTNSPLVMEADLKAQVTFSRFRAYGSLGYAWQGAAATQITTNTQNNLISREHWVGVDLGDDKSFCSAPAASTSPSASGPTSTTCSSAIPRRRATNFNDAQEYGVSLYYSGKIARAEVMGIAGNYVVNPDALRRRGYAGYVEFNVAPKATLGVSSMVTYQGQDLTYQLSSEFKNVHGFFTRYSPVDELVLFAETDAFFLTGSAMGESTTIPGFIGFLQADIEPTQGLHLIATGETMVQTNFPLGMTTGVAKGWDAGAAVLWFFAPHADIRFDFVASSTVNSAPSIYLLPQLHVYL